MCLGIPGEIVEIPPDRSDLATVDVGGMHRTINIGLLNGERLRPGDWVVIHVGFAMSKIDEVTARAALDFLDSINQAYDDELAAPGDPAIHGTPNWSAVPAYDELAAHGDSSPDQT